MATLNYKKQKSYTVFPSNDICVADKSAAAWAAPQPGGSGPVVAA
jgi:hypothetical protein